MVSVFKKRSTIILLVFILILGFFLRKSNIYTWPRVGATFDEYAWTWQGISILTTGVPTSWSPHPQYKNAKDIRYQTVHFRLVTPYLEHPPLFGLVAGSFAMLSGVKNIYQVDIIHIRRLALILGVSSVFFIFILVNEIYDKKTALISSFLYAIIPSVVVGSRIVQNENFFIPFWLLALYLTAKFINTKKTLYRNLAAIICGLLILAKIPWIAASISVVLIFLYLKKYKDIIKFLGIVIPIALLFFIYGFYYDSNLFIALWGLQLNRYDISFTSIFALFQEPFLVDRFYTDGWIYFGWFSFILVLLKDFKKNYILILGLLSYFLIFLAGIPNEPGHGWYRYPFYPFLAISIALFLKDNYAKNHILTFMFLVLVGTSLLQVTLVPVLGFSYLIFRIVIVLCSLSLLPLFFPFRKINSWVSVYDYACFASIIFLSILAALMYNEQ